MFLVPFHDSMVPPGCILNGGTVPPGCILNGGTVPPFNLSQFYKVVCPQHSPLCGTLCVLVLIKGECLCQVVEMEDAQGWKILQSGCNFL